LLAHRQGRALIAADPDGRSARYLRGIRRSIAGLVAGTAMLYAWFMYFHACAA
jgi:hypothetical protein